MAVIRHLNCVDTIKDSVLRYRVLLLMLAAIVLAACTQQQPQRLTWTQAMAEKLDDYSLYSRKHLEPYFAKAKLPYAPRELAFIVFKRSKRFEIYARNNHHEQWRYVKTYPIFAASGGAGPKLHEGDDQVPEGIYHIVGLNPNSRFDLSMHLNYPNQFDRKQAQLEHRTHLGGNIFIHGDRRSIGCVAIGDDAIEQVFPLVYAVGEQHVTVVIAPNDMRKNLPLFNREHVRWLPALYAKLKRELKKYPLT